ncbi:iron complex transport system permease protein [Austwickia chelonae]|uniref:Putative ABC transporter permease protein n=1 Tax=Austwickia chelonae NBRC 105200 TaxID=1184607 RepID=K6V8C0_9MICO|nr:putative ABC transporter permease protein [Austwickia chelonae NBRC 105200]SEW39869.1 iron complex transport system permease protein [Austwickia chelonae]
MPELRRLPIVPVLVLALGLSVLGAIRIGSTDLGVPQILYALANPTEEGPVRDIVWFVRLPRTVLAVAVGAILATSGVVMQAVVNNPLADPYVLGISSGASLGATLALMAGLGQWVAGNAVGVCAFAGAFLVSLAVQVLASVGGRADAVRLLLAGLALSSVTGAFTSLVVFLAHDARGLQQVTFWLMGSVAGARWENLVVIAPVVAAVVAFFLTQCRVLNLMLLGDETALTLGRDMVSCRHLYLLLSSLGIGMAVYAAGTIGFVGLIVPHVVRMVVGTDHRRALPCSALFGGVFLVWADVVARVVLDGGELPIGIVTSSIGAPVFIWLMARSTYRFGGLR